MEFHAIFVKLAYAEGFSLGEVIGDQYLLGWIILLAIYTSIF